MKRIILFIVLMFSVGIERLMACDVCKKNQPSGFENITHGAGPSGTIDYIIIGTSTVIVIATLYLSFKYLIKPKENNPNHIKNIVISDYGRQ